MAGNTPLNPDSEARLRDAEALLRRELAVEPSPEFLPRVRERIRNEPPAARWHWSWALPLGAVAAACVAIVAVSVLRTAPLAAPPAPRLAMGEAIGPVALPPADSDASRPVVATRDRRVRRTAAATVVASAEPAMPKVIVDHRQRAALVALVRIIRDGKLTEDSFAQTTPVTLGAIREQVTPVLVGPVTVSPIAVDGVLSSEKQ